MKWKDLPAGTVNAVQLRLWLALSGCADDFAKKVVSDDAFLGRLTSLIRANAYQPASEEVAQFIMSKKRFFGIALAQKYFFHNTEAKPEKRIIPFSAETLYQARHSHTLVYVPPHHGIFKLHQMSTQRRSTRSISLQQRDFTARTLPGGWFLLRNTVHPGSVRRTISQQNALLATDEVLTPATVLLYLNMLCYLMTGKMFMKDTGVRTAEYNNGLYGTVSTDGNALWFNGGSFYDCHVYQAPGISSMKKRQCLE